MRFKTAECREQWSRVCPLLKLMGEEFERKSLSFGVDPVITRIVGSIAGDSGIHARGMAIDFRNSHAGVDLYTPDEVKEILKHVNVKFPRSDSFRTLIHHSFKNGPFHFHLQVSPMIHTYRGMIYPISIKQEMH